MARDRHETVNHSAKEFVRGDVHVNTVEAWHDRFRRAIIGVYHHVAPEHVQAYLDEAAFRWHQRVLIGTAERKTRSGKVRTVRLWERLDPVTQMRELFAQALGGRSAAGATAASGSSKHEFGHLVDKSGKKSRARRPGQVDQGG